MRLKGMNIIALIIIGLIVGVLGRLVHPGRDAMGWLGTIAIGVAAVVLTGLVLGSLGLLGYVVAVIVAALLIALFNRFSDRRSAAY